MRHIIFLTSIAILFGTISTCAADVIVYSDVDQDGWGDSLDTLVLANPGELPNNFARLSHDPDDSRPDIFPENGPSLNFNSGFYSATVGQQLSFTVPMSGATAVEFFDTVLPSFASFDFGTPSSSIIGTFNWTPSSSDIGFHGFESYGRFVGGSADEISGTYATIEVSAAAVPEPFSAGLVAMLFSGFALSRRNRVRILA